MPQLDTELKRDFFIENLLFHRASLRLIILDKPREGVADAEYYDPRLNPLFRDVLTEIRDDGKTVQ